MREGFEDRIKERGYWRVNIRPADSQPTHMQLAECRSAVEKSVVSLRGWDYPHVNRNDEHGGYENVGEYVENWCAWFYHIELWRMYRSSQFIHLKAMIEDHESPWGNQNRPEGKHLSILGAIYTVTEIVEFASRLNRSGLYQNGATLNISLHGTRDRELWNSDPMRLPLLRRRVTQADTILIRRDIEASSLAQPREQSLEMLVELFDNFGWSPHVSQLRADQDRLYTDRV